MSNKISIITINYNNAEGLQKTIQSVVSQENKDYEYIIIDGGSNDASIDVINTYLDNIDYWVSEKDEGVYSAMNKGIKEAKGDYLIFMNSGDCFFDNTSLAIYHRNMNSKAGVYYGNSLGVYNDGSTYDILQPDIVDVKFWLFNSLNHQATMIKRELFENFGFYDTDIQIISDWKWFFSMYNDHQVSFQKIHNYLAIYDMHGLSSDKDMQEEHLALRENVIKTHFEQYWTLYVDLKKYYSIKPLDKRALHFEVIKNNPVHYRFLKSFMSILLLSITDKKKLIK